MGTHPIFESDFDCLTDSAKSVKMDVLDVHAENDLDQNGDEEMIDEDELLNGPEFTVTSTAIATDHNVPVEEVDDVDMAILSENGETVDDLSDGEIVNDTETCDEPNSTVKSVNSIPDSVGYRDQPVIETSDTETIQSAVLPSPESHASLTPT